MKRLFAVSVLLVLVGCASILGDRTVTVTGAEIQQKLNEKLAIPISLLKVFDVSLSNSLVTFDQATGRILTVMDADLSSALFNQNLSGKLGISGKLRFDAASSSIVLDAPKVEKINFDGASEKYNDLLSALAKTVGGDMLNGLTLYKVKPADLTLGSTQYLPKDLQVTNNGLQITLSAQ
jgi:hypothetical protein